MFTDKQLKSLDKLIFHWRDEQGATFLCKTYQDKIYLKEYYGINLDCDWLHRPHSWESTYVWLSFDEIRMILIDQRERKLKGIINKQDKFRFFKKLFGNVTKKCYF